MIDIYLTKKQRELLKASYNQAVVFFGGSRGGGKSYGIRAVAIIRALETPGIRIGIFRKSYPELRANHIDRILLEYPDLTQYYRSADHIIRLPNKSVIEFCHLASGNDVHLYQGREYDILIIDEAGQWDEGTFWTLRGSNRTATPGMKPVALLTGNPVGLGHKWLKRLFIDRNYNERERPDDYFFIPAKVYDCPPLIENDPDYVHRLEAEPNEILRRAYLEGDWDIFAGQFFGEFRRDVHVLPNDWQPMPHWRWFASYDHGYAHPAALIICCTDEDGTVYVMREFGFHHCRIDEIATSIKSALGETFKRLGVLHAGHDCWAKGRDGGPTIAEEFNKHHISLVQANIARVQGASHIRQYLAYQGLPEGFKGPKLLIHPSCVRTIDILTRIQHDEKNAEDCQKIDGTPTDPWGGDDFYDALRYGLMSRPSVSPAPAPEIKVMSKQWLQRRADDLKRQDRLLKRFGVHG